jgi:hypothetical protein
MLDDLIKQRFGGAVNIRGIRYQILYSVYRAFDLYSEDSKTQSLKLEGVEDVDVRLDLGDQYVQVKTADNPWGWGQLKDPIKGFLQAYRLTPDSNFVLAVNFQLRHDIARLAQRKNLPNRERAAIERKFVNLCKQVDGTIAEAQGLIDGLEIVSLTEEEIRNSLELAVTEAFGLGSEAVVIYIQALVAQFLEWARDRKTITRTDLDKVKVEIGEAFSRESEFQAYGRSLITRIEWTYEDKNATDFFEKGTRSGHIVAGLDVGRPKWLTRIGKALDSSSICILRSSSGQGKSTLMYRFAYDNWSRNHTFILRAAASASDAEQVCDYLRNRARLGLPTLLLIDDAGWNIRYWSRVAQECSALGINVLVTARHEDWHRFAREGLTNFEILEPELDLEEAKEIFRVFRTHERLHSSVDSAEWAYEKVGEPHLLIEYVYLLTHGRMLEDRLRDQVKQFNVQREDPAKIELLRRATLAHALGAPLELNQLMRGISFRDDPQDNLRALSDEYLTLDKSLLNGLHWVRSDHLARILHEGYPDMASTALTVLESVPESYVPLFVSNAIRRVELDTDVFLDGLGEKVKLVGMGFLLAVLDGIFDAGEQHFFEANKALFDEAFEEFGPSGPSFLTWNFIPTAKLDIVGTFAEILGKNGEKLRRLAARVDASPKGLSHCAKFLCRVAASVPSDLLRKGFSNTGKLLDWCALCEASLPMWPDVAGDLLNSSAVFDLTLEKFCDFTQGVFRYDEGAYLRWFSANSADIIGYLKLQTDSIDIRIEDKNLSVEFIVRTCGSDLGNDMAVSRLTYLHAAIPFCEKYRAHGDWITAFGLTPTWHNTDKDFSKEHLYFKSDTEKNAVWRRIVQNRYIPDSYYRFEEDWYALRLRALNFVRDLSSAIEGVTSGRKRRDLSSLADDAIMRLDHSLRFIRHPSGEDFETIGKSISQPLQKLLQSNSAPNGWAASFLNFFVQICQYINSRDAFTGKMDEQPGRLAVYNFNEAHSKLEGMYAVFSQFFLEAPDYFGASDLNESEMKAYAVLADLLEGWITEPPLIPQDNLRQYVRARRERRQKDILGKLRQAVAPLESEGMSFIFPKDLFYQHPARYLTLAFSVNDVLRSGEPLASAATVLDALIGITDVADFFCLIPIHKGARFLEGGYQFSSYKIPELVQGNSEVWETLAISKLPEGAMQCLPTLPLIPSAKLQLRSEVQIAIAEFEAFESWREKIEALRECRNRFEKQLHDRYKSQLLRAKQDLNVRVSAIINQLRFSLSIDQENNFVKTGLDTLTAIQHALEDGDSLCDELP